MKTSALLTGVSAATALMATGCKSEKKPEYPNIVYILADDMGFGDLSCLNPASRIQTPAMDRLAREGMIFTNAHSPSAVSTPTRYGILTGEYCFRTSLKSGVLVGYDPPLIRPGETTVPLVLKKAGYNSACIGKWHLGLEWPRKDTSLPLVSGDQWNRPHTANMDYMGEIKGGPVDHGFDYSFIIPASLDMSPYVYIRNRKLIAPVTDTIAGNNKPRGVFWRWGDIQQGFDLHTVLGTLAGEAVKYIDSQRDSKKPFFLYFALTAPHTPWLPSAEFQGKSGAGTYGDFVMQVDHTVEMVLQALRENHLDGNTLVIVTSDNGSNWTPADIEKWGHRANWIFRGQKSDVWEGGHHIPFIARWPGKILPGSQCDQEICLTDLLATCAELTGYSLAANEGPDSFSILPFLTGVQPVGPYRTSVVHHSINGMFGITSGGLKFIDGRGSGGWSSPGKPTDPPGQLYDMRADTSETTNLYEDQPDQVRILQEQLDEIKIRGTSK
jgi:arylsulfatase A